MTEEMDYDYNRALYIVNLQKGVFPWRAAYYYYTLHIDRIDIMSFAEFKETIQLESLSSENSEEHISEPIYRALDNYYSPVFLMNKDNKLIKIT